MPKDLEPETYEYPISVHYTDPAMEMGSVAIPRLFLRFHQYLCGADGQRIDPREAFFLLYVMAEKESGNDFRLATMVCPFPFRTRIDYAGKFRAMGLIYTIPHYVAQPQTARYNHPPTRRVHHVDWVLDALFSSLSQVYQTWHAEREALKRQFGKQKVFYRLTDNYTHAIEIPPHLAVAITEGKFYRVSDSLIARAREITAQLKPEDAQIPTQLALLPVDNSAEDQTPTVRLERSLGEDGSPTVRSERSLGAPTVRDSRTALVVPFTTTTTTTKDAIDINSQIVEVGTIFAEAVGAERYDPTGKESRQVATLLAEGYSVEDICAGIQRAVQLAAVKGQKVRSLAYCIPEVRNPSVRSATEQETEAETSERTAETDAGTPKPTVVTGKPSVETEPVVRKLQIESPKAALLLDALANGNAELRDLLDVIQAKNPTRVIDRGDVRAWLKLADDFAELAKERDTSPIGLVMQAVLEAIGANSNREGFLAPNLARRILERWHAQREAVAAKERAEEPSMRSTVLSEHVVVADSDDDEDEPAQPQYSRTLEGVSLSNANDIWHGTLGELQLQMTRATFDTWVRPTHALGWENGHDASTPTLVVGVQSPYAKEWLENRLNTTVQRTVTGIVGKAVEIRYEVASAGVRA